MISGAKTVFDQSKEKSDVADKKLQTLRARMARQNSLEATDKDNLTSRFLRPEHRSFGETTRVQTRTEFTVFSNTEHQDKVMIQQEITEVRQELALAIVEMKKLGQRTIEYEKAIQESIAEPGVYHLNFFERLGKMLVILRKNIQDSNSWMDMIFAKKRSKKYWNKAKKSGSTFLLSHERRMATQAG